MFRDRSEVKEAIVTSHHQDRWDSITDMQGWGYLLISVAG